MKKVFTKLAFFTLFLAGISVSFTAFAQTTYYVSTTGDDGNVGTSVSEAKRNINAAVSVASNGDVISIAAGTYAEKLYINKSLAFKGANSGIAANAWLNPATVIIPASTNFDNTAASTLFELVVNDITIDGIAFYGNNDALADALPKVLNGINVRANSGVMNYQSLSGQKVLNSKFMNFASRGVYMSTSSSNLSTLGNEIKNNVFDNISASTNDASGVYLHNYIADVSGNNFTRVDRGVFYDGAGTNVYDATNLSISNNTIAAYFRGVLMYFPPTNVNPATLIEGNNVTWSDVSLRGGTGITVTTANSSRGIAIENAKGNSVILVKDNVINGLNQAVFANSVEKSATVPDRFMVKDGTISNANDVGITLRNDLGAFTSRLVVEGTTILNANTSGLQAYGSTNPVKTEIALRNSVKIQRDQPIPGSYNHAIYLEGLQATLTELGNTKITGAVNRVITLNNNAMQGLEVDGTYMTFDGSVNGYTFADYKPALSNDNAIAIALQERILDSNPHSFGGPFTSGLIKFNFGVTLPITLVDYKAKLQNNGTVKLTWQTASELNNKGFIVSHSTDGKDFKEISRLEGSASSSIKKDYVFYDKNPASGSNYYRLQQQDLNGKITDLGIKSLNVSLQDEVVKTYPNPTVDFVNVEFEPGLYQQLDLVDMNGKILQKMPLNNSRSQVSVNLTQHLSGVYFLRLSGKDIVVKRVVKN